VIRRSLLVVQLAALAGVGPVAMQDQPVFLVREMADFTISAAIAPALLT
jgi:hypothetical protein